MFSFSSDEQQMLINSIDDAVDQDIAPILEDYEKDEPLTKDDAKAVLQTLSRQGMLGRDIPESEGGAGLNTRTGRSCSSGYRCR